MIELAPTSENEMTYEEAVLYCAFCRHNGYNDWRLPTKDEYYMDAEISIEHTMSWYSEAPKDTLQWWRPRGVTGPYLMTVFSVRDVI
jgi:hypothetical protein